MTLTDVLGVALLGGIALLLLIEAGIWALKRAGAALLAWLFRRY